jgi:hypothetical protein
MKQIDIIKSVRKPMPKPTIRHGKAKYSRKEKFKRGW